MRICIMFALADSNSNLFIAALLASIAFLSKAALFTIAI
jgi:hypothetical protein